MKTEITSGKIVVIQNKRQISTGLHYCCQNGHWVYIPKTNEYLDCVQYQDRFDLWDHPNIFQYALDNGHEWMGLIDCPDWIDFAEGTTFSYETNSVEENGIPLKIV